MNSMLFTIISFLVALAILISVHEFGHFWVARKLGVKVLRFSIGFGPALWKRTGKVDATEYMVAAIPLGGYVKMLDEREGEVAEEELHRAFNRQSLSVRSAVVAAGPLFNFLFAICAYWLVFVSGDVGTRPVVGEVTPATIAAQAGFQVGDEVIATAGDETATWESFIYTLISESAGDEDIVVLVRDIRENQRERVIPISLMAAVMEEKDFIGKIGLKVRLPKLPVLVTELEQGGSAKESGLLVGDKILSIAGAEFAGAGGFVNYVSKRPEQTVAIAIERNGKIQNMNLKIGIIKEKDKIVGRIGAGVRVPKGLFDEVRDEYRSEIKLNPIDAVGASLKKTWDMSIFMLRMLGKMLTGKASLDNLGGPISIAQTAGKSASIGAVYFLKFLAIVSVSLAVLNLLPVPVLDGGHLLFFFIEGVKGSPLSEQAQMVGQKIGIIALLLLMGVAFYVDISRMLG
jgi:regulator of sigma E protease